MNNNNNLPTPFENIMITYEKTIHYGVYGMESKKVIQTKMGFYSNLFNNFSVPPEWRKFNNVLLPHGWGGDKLEVSQVISWKYL